MSYDKIIKLRVLRKNCCRVTYISLTFQFFVELSDRENQLVTLSYLLFSHETDITRKILQNLCK